MLGFDPDAVERFFTNSLLVVGGFAVGYVLTGIVAHRFDRWATKGTSPAGLHKLARWIGGIVLAVIVALFLFQGGKGNGGTRGDGQGTTPLGTGPGSAVPSQPTTIKPPATKPETNVQTNEIIRVTILGGSQPLDKYYIAEDDGKRITDLEGIKSYIVARKRTADRLLVLELTRDAVNKTTRNNRVVTDLESWARNEERLSVIFPGDGP